MTTSDLSRPRLDAALDITLTHEQWAAVSSGLEPAVIVAGAGSGKTTSMAARVAWLVGNGYARPDAVLGLTFTTKAAASLLTSMCSAVAQVQVPDSDDLGEPQVLTYHAFASRILTENAIRIGLEPGAQVLTESARSQLAYRVVCRSDLPLASLGKSPTVLSSSLLALDDQLAELSIPTDELRAFDTRLLEYLASWPSLQVIGEDMRSAAGIRLLLADLVDHFRAEKARRDVIDFADQIRLTEAIVTSFPDVVRDLRERFAVVLLDEYQDTSIAQRKMMQAIFGSGHPVMAVGDPCQAIYGWRGASVDNIENFPRHFRTAERDAARFGLTQNRRSGPAILEIANRVSQPLRELHSGVGRLDSGDNGKGRGHVSCALFTTQQDEIEWIASQVEATRADGAQWRDIAILAATSKDLVEVDAALRRRSIPTQLVGAAALLSQPAVLDIRSWLELIHDPTANPAFLRLATGPQWRIGPRDLAALGARAAHIAGGRGRSDHHDLAAALDDAVAGIDAVDSISLTEALDDLGDSSNYSADALSRFARMTHLIHRLRTRSHEPIAELIGHVLHLTGIAVEAAQLPLQQAIAQEQAIATFTEFAAEFTDLDGSMSLGAFLTRLRDAERLDVSLELDVTGPINAVSLMTIHKSKGLEFPFVFVPFVSAGAFPNGISPSSWTTSSSVVPWPIRADRTPRLESFPDYGIEPRRKDHDAYREVLAAYRENDDQRLAYVAFTRAERGLVVSGHWWGPKQKDPRGPDRFLQIVHDACLDGFGTVVTWAPPPEPDAVNPLIERTSGGFAWPVVSDATHVERLRAVAEAMAAIDAVALSLPLADDSVDGAVIAEWDLTLGGLIEEARRRHSRERTVRLPESVSASTLIRAIEDPEQVAIDLVRPMPSAPAPAARRGTRFHAWVETRFGQQPLLDPDDLPGAADAHIESDADLLALKEAFESSVFAERQPVAIEEGFSLVVGGRVVVGRIDAVFAENDDPSSGRFDVIDWKTGSAKGLHPLQLAIYRLAWAQSRGVPVENVTAGFVMVGTGEVIRPDTDAEVARLLSGLVVVD